MFITRMSLPRRTFLRGMGATLALPLLDAMVPALSALAATSAKPARRLGFVYVPNGVIQDQWVPATTGSGFELSPTLAPLAAVRDKLLVLSGLTQRQAESFGDGNGDHARGCASWLNGVHPKRTEGAGVQAGTTIDQIAANELGKLTRLPSLELALEVAGARPRQLRQRLRLRLHQHHLVADADLAGADGNPSAGRVRSAVRRRRQRHLAAGAGAPQPEHSRFGPAGSRQPAENARLERSDQGQRVSGLGARSRAAHPARREQTGELSLQLPDRPTDIPEDFAEHMKLMFDLQVLAFQADITRVTSLLDRPRAERAQLSRDRRGRAAPLALASPRRSRVHRQEGEDRRLPHQAATRISSRSWTRRPTATARCSTTRSSCTAAGSAIRTCTSTPTCRCCWPAAAPVN